MSTTSIVTNASEFADHIVPDGFPERPERLIALEEVLLPKIQELDLKKIEPKAATKPAVCSVHDLSIYEAIQTSCQMGMPNFFGSTDLPLSRTTFSTALLAVGSVIESIDAIMKGEVKNGFVATRPPGHHAFADHPEGFCFFNNVAIGARYLIDQYRLKRVAIYDWDLHHGNGTQSIFYNNAEVLFISSHGDPRGIYPYRSGFVDEIGADEGEGFNLNIPLPRLSGDSEIREAFVEKIAPVLNNFAPEFILISAGFDAHENDPFQYLMWPTSTYDWLTEEMIAIAAKHSGNRLLSVLEGGYSIEVLQEVVPRHVERLARV